MWLPVAAVLAAACLAGCGYLVAAALAVRRFAAQPLPVPRARPGVTILKPVRGEDAELYENLKSFCIQRYPAVQVIFGVRDRADPAVGVVERLIRDLPEADLVLVVDDRVHGTNYKVSNLHNMLAAARHPIILLADSDMRAGPAYLDAIVAALEGDGVGLVTCLYAGRPGGNLWSRLGAMFINHGFLPSVLLSGWIGGREGCYGATIALRRETLDRIGGFLAVRDHLADDHALGEAVKGLGLRVTVSRYVIDDILQERCASDLFRHELRWARTIRAIEPAGFAASAVTHPVAIALVALPVALAQPWMLVLPPLALACRAWMVRAVDRALGLESTSWGLIPLRDSLSFVVLVSSFCGRTVTWRGDRFKVRPDGRLVADGESVR